MLRRMTCIVCPNGCEIAVRAEDGQILAMTGAACKRGEEYARQEMIAPMRTIASSVYLEGGELPLVSVRLDRPVPKAMILAVMEEIRKVRLTAPVAIGDVVIADVLGTGSNVIATKHVGKK